jgi:hypothetical protein
MSVPADLLASWPAQIVLLVAGLTIVLRPVYAYVQRGRARLRATLQIQPFAYPPELFEEIRRMRNGASGDPAHPFVFELPYHLRFLGGFVKIHVSNVSRLPVKNISISLPDLTSCASLRRDDMPIETAPATDGDGIKSVRIQSLKPTESVSVYAWTAVEVAESSLKALEVRSDQGAIRFNVIAPTGHVGRFAEETLRVLWTATRILLAAFAVVTIVRLAIYAQEKYRMGY